MPMEPDMLCLDGPRVALRIGEPADAAALVRFYRDNDDFFARTQNRARPEMLEPVSMQRLLALRKADFDAGRACHFVAFSHEAPREVLAVANFTAIVRGYFQACYLGYAVAEKMEGQGIMREVLELGLDFVFGPLGLHRVMANYMPENKRSGALLKRLGFRVEGYAERYLQIHGEWRDHFMTALHAEDFRLVRARSRGA